MMSLIRKNVDGRTDVAVLLSHFRGLRLIFYKTNHGEIRIVTQYLSSISFRKLKVDKIRQFINKIISCTSFL